MKSYLLLLLSLVCLGMPQVKAQEFCATEMPQDMLNWLRDYKAANPGVSAKKTSDSTVTFIPIQFHIVGTNTGGSYYAFNTLLDAFCTLNGQYAPYGMQYYMYDDINYINNDNLNLHTGNYRGTINNESVPNVVNMFFVNDPSGACGYYAGFGGPRGADGNRQGYIAIQDGSCAAPDNSTIAHELGHFFSLPHTFSGWEGRASSANASFSDERVNGSNCGFAGDYFCDTPADYLSNRWSCPYTQNKTDFNGDPYEVDGTLYMSYSNDACTSRFSDEQVDAMYSYLQNVRSYMLDFVYPGYEVITDTTKPVLPTLNALNVPANYVNLKWSSVPNATRYYLELRYDSPAVLIVMDTVVSDTSIILTDLDRFKGYKYRVRAFNPYSTCSPMSNFNIFTTGDTISLKPVVSVGQISCYNAFDGSIEIQVTNAAGTLTFQWSNGLSGSTSSLTNLTEGNFDVTVTDGVESLVLDIDLVQPQELFADIEEVGTSLQVVVTGGTPNYSYQWSTGAQGTGVQLDESLTEYSVTVTDANGCIASKTLSTVGITEAVADNDLTIYPNPLATGTGLVVQLSQTQQVDATVQVFDNTGKLVQSTGFNNGNSVVLSTNNMPGGLYIIRLTGTNVNLTRKLIVY